MYPSNSCTNDEKRYMQRAIELAERGLQGHKRAFFCDIVEKYGIERITFLPQKVPVNLDSVGIQALPAPTRWSAQLL